MTDRAALVRVAELVGVDTRYTDAFGETREASDETLRSLISAFGLPPDPAEAALFFEEGEHAASLGLRPVHLVHAEHPHPRLALRLPARTREILWTCRLEDSEERSGRVVVAQAGPVAMPLPAGLPLGYHRLAVEAGGSNAEIDLIVAPARCHLPPQLADGARSWGLTCQLYGLRSAHDWGIGDFTDLAEIAAAAGACGAAVLGRQPAARPLCRRAVAFQPRIRRRAGAGSTISHIDATAMPGFAEDEAVAAPWSGANGSAPPAGLRARPS